MFESARIKLTIWYMVIAMLVSGVFSLIIYKGVTLEIEQRFVRIEQQFRRGERGFTGKMEAAPFFKEDLVQVKHGLLLRLLWVNGFVFLFATTAGYILASKTLKPIEDTLIEQRRFVADASHELKTPITALKTSIEVSLRDKKITLTKARQVLSDSLEDINNLQILTANLLSLARYQKIGNGFTTTKFESKVSVNKAVKKLTPMAKKKKIQLKTKLTKQVIKANQEQFEKLVTILVDNATKYTPKEGKVKVISSTKNKNLVLKVIDNGIGISKKDLPCLYGRFYRVDTSRSKSKAEGFGLGLSVAKKIVNQHCGKISIKSKLGSGTTVTVKLPLKA